MTRWKRRLVLDYPNLIPVEWVTVVTSIDILFSGEIIVRVVPDYPYLIPEDRDDKYW